MARHDQRQPPLKHAIPKCISCKDYDCKKCIDVGRKVVFGQGIIQLCACDHKEQFREV